MSQMSITKKNLKSLQNSSKEFDILVDTLRPLSNTRNIQSMDKIQSILKLSLNEPLVLEDMMKIENLSPEISSFSQGLGSLSYKFFDQVESLNDLIDKTFRKYRNAEDNAFEKKMDGFNKLQTKHKLWSIWSEYSISPNEMTNAFSDKPVQSLTYESRDKKEHMKVGKIATWFEMWKIADQLMRLSGDQHHQFIEEIVEDQKKPGHFKLVTGS